ncbi:MAG: hypothetical protein LJF06_15880 [Gemmatimonadetes bacterium]|nr:hypothetical protein [Gemmatimonadota bacterium]
MTSTRSSIRRARGITGKLLVVGPLVGLLAITGCGNLLNVDNPNNVSQSDLADPTSASAQANGALAAVANGTSYVLTVVADVGDEVTQGGSRDAYRQLTIGNLNDAHNEFSDAAWSPMMQGRWMSDFAIENLSAFASAGTLKDPDDLVRSYLYGAIAYDRIADWYEDAVVGSDHMDAAPPVGEANMYTLYDTAMSFVNTGLSLAQAENNPERVLEFTAMKAQVAFHDAVWHMLHPNGSPVGGNGPADPLVNDATATAAAQAFFALNPAPDWTYRFTYSSTTVENNLATVTNEDIYTILSPTIAVMDQSGKHPMAPWSAVNDPIDGIPAPSLVEGIQEFTNGGFYSPLTVISAREMHLILAEAALAQGDNATFTAQINDVRSLYSSLSPYSGQIPAQQMLIHERLTNMFLQGFRLADLYRFGIKSPDWLPTTAAYTNAGEFFPIAYVEQLSNCHIAGTC